MNNSNQINTIFINEFNKITNNLLLNYQNDTKNYLLYITVALFLQLCKLIIFTVCINISYNRWIIYLPLYVIKYLLILLLINSLILITIYISIGFFLWVTYEITLINVLVLYKNNINYLIKCIFGFLIINIFGIYITNDSYRNPVIANNYEALIDTLLK